MELFIVVTEGGKGGYDMQTCSSQSAALNHIGNMGRNEGDPRRVHKVFSVDYKGQVDHYEIVWNGRLELRLTVKEGL